MDKPHLTKIAAAILDSQGRMLIVHHRGQDFWISPGGKPEAGETHKQTLERELDEELRIEIIGEPELLHESEIEPIPDGSGRFVKIYTYLVETEGSPEINPEDKIFEFAWMSKSDWEAKKFNLTGTVIDRFLTPLLIKQGKIK